MLPPYVLHQLILINPYYSIRKLRIQTQASLEDSIETQTQCCCVPNPNTKLSAGFDYVTHLQ